MDTPMILMVMAFLMAVSLVGIGALALTSRQGKLKSRLNELSGHAEPNLERLPSRAMTQAVQTTLPKMGKHLMPTDEEEQSLLKSRLTQAGIYHPQAVPIFLGVKMILMVTPTIIGLLAGVVGLVPTNYGLMGGACASILGMIGPSMWLDRAKAHRQAALRKSLPDAMDLIIVCMDGGLSLAAAIQRVTGELKTAHPSLAVELNILQRQVHFGQPMADAIRSFADRTDLDEVRNLAATVKNAEKFGASMIKTLKTYSKTLREKRQMQAEELAQLAGTKILFPTLLFIFPAIFLIILGPAAIQLMSMFAEMKK
jgi:tight adherence protein C